MNQDQITSIVRQILLAVGGAAVSKGWVDNGTLTALAGAFAIIVGSVWAIYTRRSAGLVESAASLSDVHLIHASSNIVSKTSSDKVTSP